MNAEEKMLDNARKRYILSEASRDLDETLQRQDYATAKKYAQCMYDIMFELCKQQNGDDKEDEKSRLKELSNLLDSLNEKLFLGGQEK